MALSAQTGFVNQSINQSVNQSMLFFQEEAHNTEIDRRERELLKNIRVNTMYYNATCK